MPHGRFHAVSVKTDRDPARALNAAMVTSCPGCFTRNCAIGMQPCGVRVCGISHSHTLTTTESPVSLYMAGPVLADRIGVAVLAECDS